MKKIFLLLALCCGVVAVDAQITTGQNTSKVVRTGNRAQEGNFGLYLGATTDMFKKITDSGEVQLTATHQPEVHVYRQHRDASGH